MQRLTVDKPCSEMSMIELAHNCVYVKDGWTRYRDYDRDIDLIDFAIELSKAYGCDLTMADCKDKDATDAELWEDLQYPITDMSWTVAFIYRNLVSVCDLRERLKAYEDTGLTPEDCATAIERLRGKCWACKHGKPYQIGAKHLRTCEHMTCAAATQVRGCRFWEFVGTDSREKTSEDEKQYPFGHCLKCGKEFNSELQNEYEIVHCPWCGEKLQNRKKENEIKFLNTCVR